MAKKTKAVKTKAVKTAPVVVARTIEAVQAALTDPTIPPVEVAKAALEIAKPLTRRARMASDVVLDVTDKPAKDRTPHTKWTWEVFTATLPATAAELVKALETAEVDEAIRTKCGNLNSHVSYYIRRKLLAPKA